MANESASNAQTDIVRRMRSESCLDRRVPLAMTPPFRAEAGPTVVDYYAKQHAAGKYGKYWLWQTSRGQQ